MVKQYRLVVLEKWVNKNSITGNDQYNITIGLPDGDSRHLNDISKTAYERTMMKVYEDKN